MLLKNNIEKKIENIFFSPLMLRIIKRLVLICGTNLIVIALFNIFELVAISMLLPFNFFKNLLFPIGRPPRRLESPLKKFETNINTGKISSFDKAIVCLVSPSWYNKAKKIKKYYNIDHLIGATLQTLEALTPNYIDNCEILVQNFYDYGFFNFPFTETLREGEKTNQKIIVIFAGVFSSYYFRAINLALQIKVKFIEKNLGNKVDVIFGGYHFRGDKQCHQEINNYGFTVADGEAENGFYSKILVDSVHNNLKLNYQSDLIPALGNNPLPYFETGQVVYLQLARGCPMGCSFCTVCGIDGNKIRYLPLPEVKTIIDHLVEQKVKNIYISDDNFCRNPLALEILDYFIETQKKLNIKFDLTIYSDLSIYQNEDANNTFMDKCRDAGVKEIFVGIESIDYDTLKTMSKTPNLFNDKENILHKINKFVSDWHRRNIGISAFFIIGSVLDKLGVGNKIGEFALAANIDTVIPTPYFLLPGSNDYKNYLLGKIAIKNFDYNPFEISSISSFINFDNQTSLSPEQTTQEVKNCLFTFYKPENIKKINANFYAKLSFVFSMVASLQNRWQGDVGLFRRNLVEKFNQQEFEKNKKICSEYSKTNN